MFQFISRVAKKATALFTTATIAAPSSHVSASTAVPIYGTQLLVGARRPHHNPKPSRQQPSKDAAVLKTPTVAPLDRATSISLEREINSRLKDCHNVHCDAALQGAQGIQHAQILQELYQAACGARSAGIDRFANVEKALENLEPTWIQQKSFAAVASTPDAAVMDLSEDRKKGLEALRAAFGDGEVVLTEILNKAAALHDEGMYRAAEASALITRDVMFLSGVLPRTAGTAHAQLQKELLELSKFRGSIAKILEVQAKEVKKHIRALRVAEDVRESLHDGVVINAAALKAGFSSGAKPHDIMMPGFTFAEIAAMAITKNEAGLVVVEKFLRATESVNNVDTAVVQLRGFVSEVQATHADAVASAGIIPKIAAEKRQALDRDSIFRQAVEAADIVQGIKAGGVRATRLDDIAVPATLPGRFRSAMPAITFKQVLDAMIAEDRVLVSRYRDQGGPSVTSTVKRFTDAAAIAIKTALNAPEVALSDEIIIAAAQRAGCLNATTVHQPATKSVSFLQFAKASLPGASTHDGEFVNAVTEAARHTAHITATSLRTFSAHVKADASSVYEAKRRQHMGQTKGAEGHGKPAEVHTTHLVNLVSSNAAYSAESSPIICVKQKIAGGAHAELIKRGGDYFLRIAVKSPWGKKDNAPCIETKLTITHESSFVAQEVFNAVVQKLQSAKAFSFFGGVANPEVLFSILNRAGVISHLSNITLTKEAGPIIVRNASMHNVHFDGAIVIAGRGSTTHNCTFNNCAFTPVHYTDGTEGFSVTTKMVPAVLMEKVMRGARKIHDVNAMHLFALPFEGGIVRLQLMSDKPDSCCSVRVEQYDTSNSLRQLVEVGAFNGSLIDSLHYALEVGAMNSLGTLPATAEVLADINPPPTLLEKAKAYIAETRESVADHVAHKGKEVRKEAGFWFGLARAFAGRATT